MTTSDMLKAAREAEEIVSSDPYDKHYNYIYDRSHMGSIRMNMRLDISRAVSTYMSESIRPRYGHALPTYPEEFKQSLIRALYLKSLHVQQIARLGVLYRRMTYWEGGEMDTLLDALPGGAKLKFTGRSVSSTFEQEMRLRLTKIVRAEKLTVPMTDVRTFDGNGSVYMREKVAEFLGAFAFMEEQDTTKTPAHAIYYFDSYDKYVTAVDRVTEAIAAGSAGPFDIQFGEAPKNLPA